MATSEAASGSLGPRYAPEDPTLPQPWKGLIDGSTGVMYYWNPETNVTQYEKPGALPPPLPSGPPPVASTPKLNPVPGVRPLQVDGVQGQQNQQMTEDQQPQGQFMSSSLQQQPQQTAQIAQQQFRPTGQVEGSQLGPAGQQQGHLTPQQLRPQIMQQPGQQISSHLAQMPMQPVQQGPPPSMQQVPVQPGQLASYQGTNQIPHGPQGQMYPQMGHTQGFQFSPQQPYYIPYQQNMPPQGPQSSSQQSPHMMQGQHFPHQQEHKRGFTHKEDVEFQQEKKTRFSPAQQSSMQGQQFPHQRDHKIGFPQSDFEFHQGKQVGFSAPQIQQTGTAPAQNMPAGMNSMHAPQPSQTINYGESSVNLQQSNPAVQLHKGGPDVAHQQPGSRFQNQIGPGVMHGDQQNVGPLGAKMGHEENHFGRAGNEYHYNRNKDVHGMPPQQPTLAALPIRRSQQEMRMPDFAQHVPPSLPGRVNFPTGSPLQGVYRHASGGLPFQDNATVMLPQVMPGLADPTHLSAAEYRQKHEVTATGDNVPAPFMTFEAAGFPQELLQEIRRAGFSAPTPIQAQTWPIALQNRDIVAIAKTGSGKTLGYLVPAFIHLRERRNNARNGPTVLVLAPTRELATQIQDEAIKFGRSSGVSCTCLYGGAPKGPQLKELDQGADVVVATPGRLNDILEMKRIDFRQVSLLVLDEADRMLDMGFEPQIRKIVNEIPPRRQTLMYTATWPKEVRKIASDLLINPVQVNIGSVDELAANKSITQYVEVLPELEKQRRVEQILRSQEHGSKVIIFCSTKRLCDMLARNLGRNFGAAAIHGDKSQGERDWVLNQFRTGKSPILVATDVAARGLDIRDIRVVINYDFPTGIEDYVHRIGRTGRAGATGVSYTFFSEQDWKYAPDLVKVLEGANQEVPPQVREIALRGGSSGKDRVGMNRYDSADAGGRWDAGGRGGRRDGGFGRGGGRDGGFGGRGGMRDGGFSGRGGRDVNFGGRGGGRDSGFAGSSGARAGWDRSDRGPIDRYDSSDIRGRGRGRGRGRFDNRRDAADRRGRSYSSSPERVRTWGYSRSRSRSRSSSRGRSYSRSRSRSRSWSRSRSPRRSRSRSPRRSRSSSRSYERYERRPRKSGFDQMEVPMPNAEVPLQTGAVATPPDTRGNGFSGAEPAEQVPQVANVVPGQSAAEPDVSIPPMDS